MIELIQTEFSTSQENLALEEVILDDFLTMERTPLIRLWGNEELSVVLGRGEKVEQQVHLTHCQKEGIPILRRVSGGGSVLHGPGNLNLSFFLPWSFHPDLKSIPASYQLILGWVREALEKSTGVKSSQKGTCDICIGDKKISGTAQARKRHGLLHHLTLLVDFDIELIPLYLKEPEKRPEYREVRHHEEFVTSISKEGLSLNRTVFIQALQESMGAKVSPIELDGETRSRAQKLAVQKYQSEDWNLRGRPPRP